MIEPATWPPDVVDALLEDHEDDAAPVDSVAALSKRLRDHLRWMDTLARSNPVHAERAAAEGSPTARR